MTRAAVGRLFERPNLPLPLVLGAPLLGLLAVRSPGPTAAFGVGLTVTLLAMRRLVAAVGLFTVLTFFEGAPGVGGRYSMVKLATLVILLAWAGLIGGRRWRPNLFAEQPVVAWCAVVLAAWAAASVLWAIAAGTAVSGAFRLVQMLLLLFVAFAAIRDGRELRLFAWFYIVGAVLTAIVPLVGLGAVTEAGNPSTRFGGYVGNPNNLAALLLPAIALTAFMWLGSRRRPERRVLLACGLLLLVTLVLTQSRGGLIGLAATAVAALVFGGPARRYAVAGLAVLATAGVAYFAAIAPAEQRARATTYSLAESTGRVDLWRIGWRMFEDHPLQGVGMQNFTVTAPAYLEGDLDVSRTDLFLRNTGTLVHNTYLNVLTDLGVVGGLLFFGLIAGIIGGALTAIGALARAGDRATELLARGLLSGVIGLLVSYFFFSAQYEKQLWLLLGTLASLSTVAAARHRRPVEEPDPDDGDAHAVLSY
jgi:O-antigen ligase